MTFSPLKRAPLTPALILACGPLFTLLILRWHAPQQLTRAQVAEIAKRKMADLNAHKPEAAERIVMGTARSMGIDIV